MIRFGFKSSIACLVAGAIGGASLNKGGHRERAIQAVDRAIEETRGGIGFAGG